MQIKEGVIHRLALVDNTLRDLHNSLYPTKAKFISCFIIHLKKNSTSPTWETHIPSDLSSNTWESYIPNDLCSPTWQTHIPSDLSSFTWETDMPNVMCFPHLGNTYS